ncbi:DNA translocase FtsK [Rhizobium sp. KVB221]|uniref:DNA translocase FtsK n=1 Tax=Rhizobium setariae TaxID=2801340 RepID=A0A936YLG2_9HYPH|nr:DNA translocase FtsK [Rhizobium setariae]MBL0372629.1 DNA translocase FtsK [Rhizobium setariae]
MRIPRTNFNPAAFGNEEQSLRSTEQEKAYKEGVALQRLRALGERACQPDDVNWESHFFLASNVRFTRTPERAISEMQTVPETQSPENPISDAETPAAEPQVEGPSVDQLYEAPARAPRIRTASQEAAEPSADRFSTMMVLQGRMDTKAAIPDVPVLRLNASRPEKVVKAEPTVDPIVEPVAVQAEPARSALSQLSDFAFWESMAFAPPVELDQPTVLREIASTMAAEVVPQPIQRPASSAISMYKVIECATPKEAAKAEPTVPAVTPSVATAMPVTSVPPASLRAPAWPWSQRPAPQPAAVQTEPLPVTTIEVPEAAPTVRAVEAPVEKPQASVAEVTGVAISKPFKIEPAKYEKAAHGEYEFPPRALLQDAPATVGVVMTQEQLERNAGLLESVLEDFGVRGEIIHVRPGPVVTLYEFEPAPGVKSSRVIGLSDDIARSMSALSARVAVIPGRNVIGIELPNATRETVYFSEMIDSKDFSRNSYKLPLCLGKTIGGEPVIAELAKMPHLLVAGTTGSGKSVAINTMILSLLYRFTPEECRLIMVDPKMLELSVYDGIPHLLTPVVTDPKKAVMALKWAVREMEDRYRKMSRLSVRNIDGYNARAAVAREQGETITAVVQTGFEKGTGEPIHESQDMDLAPMPYIVVIVDEMADLMMVAGKEIEGTIQRLAQMARAAGIHLIMATQRPSVDVITGTIKANFPTRISFQVTSKIDSRTILGEQGAEQLLGQGDMLHMAGGGRISRVHGPFVSDEEVEKVVAHLKTQGRPEYLETVTTDEEEDAAEEQDTAVFDKSDMASEDGNDLFDKAVKVVLRDKKCSTSYIQRRLGIGYNKAASLVERMEKEGLVGAANHVGKREIIRGNHQDTPVETSVSGDD